MTRSSYSRQGVDDPYRGQSRRLLDSLKPRVSFDPALMPAKGNLFDPALRHGISLRLMSKFLVIRYANLYPDKQRESCYPT